MFVTDGDPQKPVDVYCLVTNNFVDSTIARLVGVTKTNDLEDISRIDDIRFYEDSLYADDWETMIGSKQRRHKKQRKIKATLAFTGSKILKVLSDIFHHLASKDLLFLITFVQYRFAFGTDSISNRELKIIAKRYGDRLNPMLGRRKSSGGDGDDSFTGTFYTLNHYLRAMRRFFSKSDANGTPFWRYVNELKRLKDDLCSWSHGLIETMSRQSDEFRDLDQSVGIIASNFLFKHLLRASPHELPVQTIVTDHASDVKKYVEMRTNQIRDFVRKRTMFDDDVDIDKLKCYRFVVDVDTKLNSRKGFGFNCPLTIRELSDYIQKCGAKFYPKSSFFLYRANAFTAIKVAVQLGSIIPAYDCLTGQERTDITEPSAWTRQTHKDGLKPGTPLLLISVDPRRKQYRYQTLTSPSSYLNKIFCQDNELRKRLKEHYSKPSWDTHRSCAKRVSRLCTKNGLCFHEYVNPGLPVYTISIDVDSKSERFINWLKTGNKWQKRLELVAAFERVISSLYTDYLGVKDCELDTNLFVFVYETQGQTTTTSQQKKGFRVIVKCRKVVFESISPVYALLNVLQILMNRDPILKLAGKSSIDNAMYLNGFKSLRMPLCCKSAATGEGCLVPLFVDPRKMLGQLTFSAFLIHHKPSTYCDHRVRVVTHVPAVSTRMIREATSTETIHRDMYASKFKGGGGTSTKERKKPGQRYESTISWFERHKEKVLPIRNLRTSRPMPNHEKTRLMKSTLTPVGNLSRQYFKWADKIYFCPHKQHTVEDDHPVSYSVRIRRKTSPVTIQVFAWCWGSECLSSAKKPVKTYVFS